MKENNNIRTGERLEPFPRKFLIRTILIPLVIIVPVAIFFFLLINKPFDADKLLKQPEIVRGKLPKETVEKYRLYYGKQAFNFNLDDNNGNRVSLDQFKGKIVHLSIIDYKSLHKNGEDYHRFIRRITPFKNVVSVTIFLGRDHTNWQHLLSLHQLGGVNLIAAGSTNTIMEQYKVERTPHNVILNAEGNIIGFNTAGVRDHILPDYLIHMAQKGIPAAQAFIKLYNEVLDEEECKWIDEQTKRYKRQH